MRIIFIDEFHKTTYPNTHSFKFTTEANVYDCDDFMLNWSRSFVKVGMSVKFHVLGTFDMIPKTCLMEKPQSVFHKI